MASTIYRRQGDRLPAIKAQAFTATNNVDLTQFASITFRMVCGATVVTGPASGDANGNLTYNLGASDTAVPGTYSAYFIATDGTGKVETLPTGENLTVVIVPTI